MINILTGVFFASYPDVETHILDLVREKLPVEKPTPDYIINLPPL